MKITKSILKQMIAEQMSEVFQSGITVQSPKQAHKYYVEAVKDYRAVAGKIQQMLPEEQKEKGEKAIFGTEYAIKETMKLVKFALENEGMSRQQKDELIEDLDSLDYEADDVKDILVLVNPTPEELENLVYDLIEKYEVANAYLMGILEGRYTDTSDADFEDAGKQMGLGLQEEKDLDEGFTYDTMTDEEKKKAIAQEERMIAVEKERLKKSLAYPVRDEADAAYRERAKRTYKRNVEKSEKRIARLKGGKPDPVPANPYPTSGDSERRGYQESKLQQENQEYDEQPCHKLRNEYESTLRRIGNLEAELQGFKDDGSNLLVSQNYAFLRDDKERAKYMKEKNPQCFDKEYVIPLTPDQEREKRFMDTGDFGELYKESKKDLLKRIVAEELAKMEIEAMEESGELDEITFSGSGIDFSGKDKDKDSITLDDMSVRGVLSRMGSDSVEGQQAKDAMDTFLARHQGRAAKREQNKRDQFSAVKDAEERRFIGAAQKRAKEQQVKIQGIRDSMKDGGINREDAVYIMSLDGSDDLKDYNDDAVQPRDKIGS